MLPSIHLDEDGLGKGRERWQKLSVIAVHEITIVAMRSIIWFYGDKSQLI